MAFSCGFFFKFWSEIWKCSFWVFRLLGGFLPGKRNTGTAVKRFSQKRKTGKKKKKKKNEKKEREKEREG